MCADSLPMHAPVANSSPFLPFLFISPGFNRTESMECFLKLRMCQLGFTATAAESAAKSTAVMDPAAATFSILQSALAKTYKPVTAARVSSLVRRVPSENNFARLQAQKAT